MRTMRIKLLGLLATMLLGATASFGQAVYYDADEGGVVIDCTMMPEGTILAESMEDEAGYQLPSHTEAATANTVYPKLVVAMEDLSSNTSSTMNWADAVTAAMDYGEGTGLTDWRLPNQRELMLIWVLRDKIEDVAKGASFTGDSFQSSVYWSSTVSSFNSLNHWYVGFGTGTTNYGSASTSVYARAVREIKLP